MLSDFRSDNNNLFYSKIDTWLGLTISLAGFIVIVACIELCIESTETASVKSMAFAFLLLSFEIALFLFIADAFIRCRYIFKEDHLYIQSGIFVRVKIPYKNIKSFCESKSLTSAPASSLDRIKIVYENEKNKKEYFTLVSPRNKRTFMEKLNAIIKENK